MLRRFQSPKAILQDMAENGLRYFIARAGGKPAGYAAIKTDAGGEGMFLSKLYLHKQFRGLGIARKMMDLFTSLAREQGSGHIWLTVNRNNAASIAAYQKMGFEVTAEVVKDIGAGFVMDDFRMQKNI